MSNDFRVPGEEIERRREETQKALRKAEIDGLFMMQRTDLFYYTGTGQTGFLYMPAEGEPLLLIRRYFPRARRETCLERVVEIASVKEAPGRISDFYGGIPDVIGLELDVIPARELIFYQRLFPGAALVDGAPVILESRMIKSDWEIRQMESTAALSAKTFAYMAEAIRPGIPEMEFAGMYETRARRLGCDGGPRVRHYQSEGYAWHILGGDSGGMVGVLDSPASGRGTSPAFPMGGGARPLAANEPIMIDFGVSLNGYHLDETRMFSIGPMAAEASDACRAAIEIHDGVLAMARPGVSVNDLFQESVAMAGSLGYGDAFLGPPGYQVRFIGHGVGLELIEPPIIAKGRKDRLKPGMVLALEPKMVFDGRFTAGVESVFLVTETGARLISKTPVKTFEVAL
ncbi:MAG: aminopeptidase P family protein [Desulfobacterales bacterium]|nr:aminopeptidase P family protein [Desulfobacterales bacterium]